MSFRSKIIAIVAAAALILAALIVIVRRPRVAVQPSIRDSESVMADTAAPAMVDSLAARRPDYRLLLHALARYRALAADTTIASFPTPSAMPVHPGDSLGSLAALRARLTAVGDLDRATVADTTGRYTGTLVDAVRDFQRRHGLDDDGILGVATVHQLQTPLAVRVRQIGLSLDRIRAEPPLKNGPYIVVNVPAFHLFAFNALDTDSASALDMRVIVGNAVGTPTPTLVGELRYLDFWPDWNVPRSILVKDILPKLARDPMYLRHQDMELVRGNAALGDTVTPKVIAALQSGALRVRQRRGPTNSLGLVKFVIPNDSDIYLHDTPAKALFAQTRRDFSHGCIRLKRARDLAIWAIGDHLGWDADSVDAALAGPDFRRVRLPRPIPVMLEYIPAMAIANGVVWFLPDVYGSDSAAVNAWRDSLPVVARKH